MDILVLTPRVPYPPDRGDRIRSYHLLSRLGRRHRLWLVSVDDSRAEAKVRAALGEFCEEVHVVPRTPARQYFGAMQSFARGEPLTPGWFHHPDAARAVHRLCRERSFDLCLVFSSAMAHYWQEWVKPHGIPAFVDFIDLDSAKLRQHAEQSPAPRRWVHAREARLLVQLEREVAEEAMGSSFVSGAEVEAFERSGSDARVVALENGVDGEYFAAPQIREISDPPRLIFVGQMRYAANIDAVRHLVDDILPLIRERCGPVQLDIIGPHPAPSVAALRAVSGVHVKGWIEDTRPYLWRASVAVVPLRLRQGTQNKVLEPMAASVPCVVSSIAARGLAQPSGPHIRVADHPAAFADAVEELLKNPEAARAQAEAALKLVQEHHNWDLVAARFESLLMEAVGA